MSFKFLKTNFPCSPVTLPLWYPTVGYSSYSWKLLMAPVQISFQNVTSFLLLPNNAIDVIYVRSLHIPDPGEEIKTENPTSFPWIFGSTQEMPCPQLSADAENFQGTFDCFIHGKQRGLPQFFFFFYLFVCIGNQTHNLEVPGRHP